MIKNIVFDIGNVLTDFRWKEFLQDKGMDETMIKRIAKASVMSPYWDEFDRGAMSEEDTIAEFIKIDPEIEKELHLAYDDITGMVVPRKYAIPWVKALKKNGYGVYFLSNFSRKAEKECSESLEFMQYCDGGILSYRELVVKPNPEIYRRLFERFSLEPSECLFLDDTERNIEAGRTLGMDGIVFGDPAEAIRELADKGVDVGGLAESL